MKSTRRATPVPKVVGEGDEKVHQIVDEVDRFLKSVHADIEDWKFSMEDYGDGTRIFVRFQIHLDKSMVSSDPERTKARLRPPTDSSDRGDRPAIEGERIPAEPGEVAEELHAPEGNGAAQRADMDLASFVQDWRQKRDSNLGGEFHKAGAPYVDGRKEWNGHKRSSDPASPDQASEHSDEEPKVPHAGT